MRFPFFMKSMSGLGPALESLHVNYIEEAQEHLVETLEGLTSFHLMEICEDDILQFVSFARLHPNITTLKCDSIPDNIGTMEIGPEVLPRLRALDAPWDLAKFLIRGRPLEEIRVSGAGPGSEVVPVSEVLRGVASGVGTVHRLELVSFLWDGPDQIADYVPHVKTFTIQVHGSVHPKVRDQNDLPDVFF